MTLPSLSVIQRELLMVGAKGVLTCRAHQTSTVLTKNLVASIALVILGAAATAAASVYSLPVIVPLISASLTLALLAYGVHLIYSHYLLKTTATQLEPIFQDLQQGRWEAANQKIDLFILNPNSPSARSQYEAFQQLFKIKNCRDDDRNRTWLSLYAYFGAILSGLRPTEDGSTFQMTPLSVESARKHRGLLIVCPVHLFLPARVRELIINTSGFYSSASPLPAEQVDMPNPLQVHSIGAACLLDVIDNVNRSNTDGEIWDTREGKPTFKFLRDLLEFASDSLSQNETALIQELLNSENFEQLRTKIERIEQPVQEALEERAFIEYIQR